MYKRTIPQNARSQQASAHAGRLNVNIPEHVATAVRIKAIKERRPLWRPVTDAIAKYCGVSPNPPKPKAARKPAKPAA